MNIEKDIVLNGISTFPLSTSKLHESLSTIIRSQVGLPSHESLDVLHNYLVHEDLNSFRLDCLNKMNTDSYASRLIMEHVGHYLKPILGPDIAIQKNIGLSIQLPEDSSSLLPIHSDVFSSDCSPYELVVWIPLTTCFDTKSMFYLPFKSFKTLSDYLLCVEKNDLKNSSALLDNVQSDIQFLSTQPPEVTLFCHSIWHGNVVNKTCETRVSINVRVKNVFTPYRGKKLGDFFEIGSLSPLSQLFTDIDSIYDCK